MWAQFYLLTSVYPRTGQVSQSTTVFALLRISRDGSGIKPISSQQVTSRLDAVEWVIAGPRGLGANRVGLATRSPGSGVIQLRVS